LPETWNSEGVEFIVGDILRLPFPSRLFNTVASLNLLDKVPFPLKHLKEMNRVAKEHGAQFLFSDPFSWTSDIAKEKDWLGGTLKGPYAGRGINNVLSLLRGKDGEISPRWNVEKEGDIWWKIRNHRNHFELIRSCFIKAIR
jgi:SAM-dependent methyltransferase